MSKNCSKYSAHVETNFESTSHRFCAERPKNSLSNACFPTFFRASCLLGHFEINLGTANIYRSKSKSFQIIFDFLKNCQVLPQETLRSVSRTPVKSSFFIVQKTIFNFKNFQEKVCWECFLGKRKNQFSERQSGI